MTKLSLIDKLNVVWKLSKESKLYIVLLIIFICLGVGLSLTNAKNKKRNMLVYIIVASSIAIFVIASYHSSLGNMFSYMMNHLFIAIYFPNLAIYFAGLIATNIILWTSIFNLKSSKQIRTLNITIYVIMNYLLFLLLNVVNKNKLDVFNQEAIYTNQEARSLIELSSIVFIVWIVFLILYKIILIYLRKDYKPKVKKIIVRKKVKKLPNNYEPKVIPKYVYGNVPHRETIIIKEKEEDPLLKELSAKFTLEDYKLMSKLLKESKSKKEKREDLIEDDLAWTKLPKQEEKSREEQKQEIIRMEAERRELLRREQERLEEIKKHEIKQQEIIKIEQEKLAENEIEEEREFAKLTELERLYRSIR